MVAALPVLRFWEYFSLSDGNLVCLLFVRAAPDIPEMSVPGVGYSFKPKGLAFVTPLYPV